MTAKTSGKLCFPIHSPEFHLKTGQISKDPTNPKARRLSETHIQPTIEIFFLPPKTTSSLTYTIQVLLLRNLKIYVA